MKNFTNSEIMKAIASSYFQLEEAKEILDDLTREFPFHWFYFIPNKKGSDKMNIEISEEFHRKLVKYMENYEGLKLP